jgi:hypothetical protein
VAGAEGDVVADGEVDGDDEVADVVAQPAANAITSAPATTHPRFLLVRIRRIPDRRSGSAMATGADGSGEDADGEGADGEGGAAPAPSDVAASGVPDVASESGRAEEVSWSLVGSYSFMMARSSDLGSDQSLPRLHVRFL